MDKRSAIREGIVVRLLAADEEMTVDEATNFWGGWKAELEKNPDHFGDCTKEPQTCNRCLVEDYYRQADEIMKFEDSQGVVIKVERKLPKLSVDLEPRLDGVICQATLNAVLKAGYVATEPLIKNEANLPPQPSDRNESRGW